MCPTSKSVLDEELDNPSLTPEEQEKLTSIESTIDQLLNSTYEGSYCDIDKIQYF